MEFVPDAVKDGVSANLWSHGAIITGGDFRALTTLTGLEDRNQQINHKYHCRVPEINIKNTTDVKILEVRRTLLFIYGKSTAGCYTTRPHA